MAMPHFRHLALAVALTSCGSMSVPAPPPSPAATTSASDATQAGGIPPQVGAFTDTSPAGMLTKLQLDLQSNTGYRSWANDGLHYIADLKVYGTTYCSATLKKSMDAGAPLHPVGSVSVLELYADEAGKSLKGWAVLAKVNGAADASAWLSYEVKKTNGVFGNPSVYSLGDPACAACHTPVPGYMIPLPAK